MSVSLRLINDTPVFILDAPENPAWTRVFGATKIDGRWAFPAYYPLGHTSKEDLNIVGRGIQWDTAAREQVERLDETHARMTELDADYLAGRPITLDVPADFNFRPEPYRHQLYGIRRGLLRWRDWLLWEMGTGKTKVLVEILRLLRARGEFKRAVVVVPPIVIPTWEREVAWHSQGTLTTYVWQPKSGKRVEELQNAKADILIMSYARARMEVDGLTEATWTLKDLSRAAVHRKKLGKQQLSVRQLETMKELIATPFTPDYDVIVADESHNLGSFESRQTKSVLSLSMRAKRRYELTGTAGDRPEHLYSQLRFLAPALMPLSYTAFREAHLRVAQDKPHMILGYKRLNELNATVESVATRAKKQDCLDLPPMTIQDQLVTPMPKQIARYNELTSAMASSLEVDLRYLVDPSEWSDEEKNKSAVRLAHGATRVMKLLQVASGFLIVGPDPAVCDNCPWQESCVEQGIRPYTPRCNVVQEAPASKLIRDFENPKLEVFEHYLNTILKENPTNKILCWGTFLLELDDMESIAKKHGWGYVRVDGSNTKNIQEYQDRFQGDDHCRVYIGQVSSGVGVSLTAANYAIYYALPWNRIHYRQSLERNNRPGQTRPMTVYRLMVKNTLDEFIGMLLNHKDMVAYTLTEKVACASCNQQLVCGVANIRPFRVGCKYETAPNRPIATATLIRGK